MLGKLRRLFERRTTAEEEVPPDRLDQDAPTEAPTHVLRVGPHEWSSVLSPDPRDHREHVEPWLTALFQAEHLNLLVGNGLTTAIAVEAGVHPLTMDSVSFECACARQVDTAAAVNAQRLGRPEPNFEDQIRAAWELIGGLRILGNDQLIVQAAPSDQGEASGSLSERASSLAEAWEAELDRQLTSFLEKLLRTERGIHDVLVGDSGDSNRIRRYLASFLLAFASRTASRERLHVFTTNYDRLVEYGCDLVGLRIVDRFVGTLAPVFRSSRLGVDMHYNPPGMRGEPRFLEGVVRLTKLHGSLDWRSEAGPSGREEVKRYAVPFGSPASHPGFPARPIEGLLVYPTPAKDVATLEYPYAELFRDLAAAVCQPNAVLVTYGYGFGDDHVNRVLRDMLTIPSTQLVIISYDQAEGRILDFCESTGREEQLNLLIGDHFAHLPTLVEQYLPRPAIDKTTWRMVEALNRRVRPKQDDVVPSSATPSGGHQV